MTYLNENIAVINHNNIWGEWIFIFKGCELLGLHYIELKTATNKEKNRTNIKILEEPIPSITLAAYKKSALELDAYLTCKLRKFTIPFRIIGTNFQTKVWNETCKIPYGETRTYKQIAKAIGTPHAERAVGNALHVNPIQIIVPCHRVICSNGGLGGYALGLDLKRRLLEMEGSISKQ